MEELNLTEGRSTGIPKILKAMKENGSPRPEFDTDEDRSYFLICLPVHPKVMSEKTPEKILALLCLNPKLTIAELAQRINRLNSAVERAIRKLKKSGHLKRIGPDKGGHWQVVGKDDE